MIRLLRHEKSIPREDDGAVRFDDWIEKFKVKFVGPSEWTVDAWVRFLARTEEKVSVLLEPTIRPHIFLYFRAIQGHSGGNLVDP